MSLYNVKIKHKPNLAELLSFLQHYAKRKRPFEDVFNILCRDYTIPKDPAVKPSIQREYDRLLIYSNESRNRYGRI